MVEQNIGERSVLLGRVEVVEVNTGVSKGLVRGRKHRERTRALQGCDQTGMGQRRYQRVVNAGCCSVGGYVLRRISGSVERKGGGSKEGYD